MQDIKEPSKHEAHRMSSRPSSDDRKPWILRFSSDCVERKPSARLADQQQRDEAHSRLARPRQTSATPSERGG